MQRHGAEGCPDAPRALTLCDELKESIPGKIAAIKATPFELWFRDTSVTEETFPDHKRITLERRAVASLENLLKDLPDIRAYCAKKLGALET